MARPLRLEIPGGCYHVFARGDKKIKLYYSSTDYLKFIEKFNEVFFKFNIELFAYCLMPNHYHLLIKTNESNLSKAMHVLNTSYSNWFKIKHEIVGHVFQGRYKSILIDSENYLLNLIKYIHNNPVKDKIVEKIDLYQWSSYNDYIHSNNIPVLNKQVVLKKLNDEIDIALKKFIVYHSLYDKDKEFDYKRKLYKETAIGDESFIKQVEILISNQSKDSEIKSLNMDKKRRVNNIVNGIKKIFKINNFDENKKVKHLTVYILSKYSRLKQKEIGSICNLSVHSVSVIKKRVEENITNDKFFKDNISIIEKKFNCRDLTPL
ncbi:MAG: transposase [Candidatus Muiribacteriota bacterium]